MYTHTPLKFITNAGQPTDRQTAKAHTFAPLYGATGFGRTPAEAEYYSHFNEKYEGISAWHSRLATEALTTKKNKNAIWPRVQLPRGSAQEGWGVSYFTQIKNYPVQSFATADIVPLVLVTMEDRMREKNLKSLIVNTVHDSIVIDIHPDEFQQVMHVLKEVSADMKTRIDQQWGIDMNVPMLLEAKAGPNWLDTQDVE